MPQQIQQLADGSLLHLNDGGSTRWMAPDPNLVNQQTSMFNAAANLAGTQALANAQTQAARYGYMGQQAQAGALQARATAAPYEAYAPAAANMYGSYANLMGAGSNAMGQMYNSYANAFGGYGNALASLATAQANENGNRYAAYAHGNTGLQNMLGALGTSALGAYGSSAVAAQQAQAMRESAAMKMMADSLSANQAATAAYGGQQAGALAGIGSAYANAAGNIGGARAALANASGNMNAAGANSLANVAGNSMNFTRDMAKLDLARYLGAGQINAASSMSPAIASVGGGNLSLSGPDGTIASGSYGGAPGGAGGGSGSSAPYSMEYTPGWYASPQYYDAGGKDAVLSALGSGNSTINAQGAGIASDAKSTFGGIRDTGSQIANSGILDSLNKNYSSGMQSMMDMYHAGRKDPADLLQSTYANTQGLVAPFLQAGKDAYAQFLNQFQQRQGPDSGAYLASLNSGWNQFQPALNRQNANVLAALSSGRNTYQSSAGNLANQMRWATGQVARPGYVSA